MKPLMYSELDARNKNIGWRRTGSNIKYFRNNTRVEDENGNSSSFYSLTWTCQFTNTNDTVYFAHCYPYTYSDLQVDITHLMSFISKKKTLEFYLFNKEYIKKIQEDPVKSKYCKVKIMCRSLAENLIHLITITNPPSSESENVNKKGNSVSSELF